MNSVLESIEMYSSENSDIFQVTELSLNVFEIAIEGDQSKYLIFDNPGIYTSIELFIQYIDEIKTNVPQGSIAMRLPHFAGCSGNDIGEFLLGSQKNIDIGLDKKINFLVPPADFNTNGLKYFSEYLESLYIAQPVFKSNNNFKNYMGYFIDEIQALAWKVNKIIPLDADLISPNLKSIKALFGAVAQAKEDSKDK